MEHGIHSEVLINRAPHVAARRATGNQLNLEMDQINERAGRRREASCCEGAKTRDLERESTSYTNISVPNRACYCSCTLLSYRVELNQAS